MWHRTIRPTPHTIGLRCIVVCPRRQKMYLIFYWCNLELIVMKTVVLCLFCFVFVLFFSTPSVPSWVYTMVGCCSILNFLCGYVINMYISVCYSCDSFYLTKWKGPEPPYYLTQGPANASKSPYACSQWCIEEPGCMLLSWTPGSCWKVGLCGTPDVTGTLYYLKKEPVG